MTQDSNAPEQRASGYPSDGRVPPHNLDAEQSSLGGILLRNDAIDEVIARGVIADDFYLPGHRAIFEAMLELHSAGQPIDTVTVAEQVRRTNSRVRVSEALLADLASRVPTASNVGYYARIIAEKASLRSMISACGEIASRAFADDWEHRKFLDWAEGSVYRVAQRHEPQSYASANSLVIQAVQDIDARHRAHQEITGVRSGLPDLDRITAGFQLAELILLAGRPGSGKTALACQVALDSGVPTLVFSVEMAKKALIERMLASAGRLDGRRIRTGHLEGQEWAELTQAAARVAEAPVVIDDSSRITVMQIRSKVRRWLADRSPQCFPNGPEAQPLRLIIVDYLQLVEGSGEDQNRELEVGNIGKGLKEIAKETNTPVLAISALRRAANRREAEQAPTIDNLRECVTGDTLVVLGDGSRVPVSSLVGKQPTVMSVSSSDMVTPALSDRVWAVGVRPVVKIKLASGREIKTTKDHRLRTWDGWSRVGALAVGGRIAISRYIPDNGSVQWSDEQVVLLAHLVGDGSYLEGLAINYGTQSEQNRDAVIAAAGALGCGTRVRRRERDGFMTVGLNGGNRWHHNPVRRWLMDLGIFNQRSPEKHLPVDVFGLPQRQVSLFLRHLWATDGTLGGGIAYSTSSESLARGVMALLLRFRIVARMLKTPRRPGTAQGYIVRVSGSVDELRLLREVGAFGPRVGAARKLMAKLKKVHPNTNVDTLPLESWGRVRSLMKQRGVTQRAMAKTRGTSYGGTSHFRFCPSRNLMASYADILGDDVLLHACSDDLFWDRIVAVEDFGEEEVFDLTVPGNASWLADGVVSHNSGQLEFHADDVVFTHKPPRPKKADTEWDENNAQIIVGKQRNGPTGSCKVLFRKEMSRFDSVSDREEPGDTKADKPEDKKPEQQSMPGVS